MKKTFIICLLLIMTMGMFAQEETNLLATRATSLSRNYLRPSMTKIFITDGSSVSRKAVDAFLKIPDNKFDQNVISDNVFSMSGVSKDPGTRDKQVKERIENILKQYKISNQIMKNWFPKFDAKTKSYSSDVLLQRGQFAATDNDVLVQNASQRQSLMYELGESLIDRSYAVFYLIKDDSFTDKNGKFHEFVTLIPYVYKLDFNKDVMNDFYTNYFSKKNGVDECNFPMQYIMNGRSGISENPNDLNEGDFEDLMTIVGKKVADFQVKTPVYSVHPIRAKIGTKEGVRLDKRFAIMEYRQDENGKEYSKRIANVRAKSVADNNSVATGHSEELSSFYQIKGGHIREGMTLVENPDFGISVDAQYNLSSIELSVGLRLSRLLGKMPGTIFFINAGVLSDGTGKVFKVRAHSDKEGWHNTSVMKIGVGIGKEFNFARSFVFTPSVAGGLYLTGDKVIVNDDGTASYDANKSALDAYYLEGTLKLGYMVLRNLQAYVEGGYQLNIIGKQFKYMRDAYAKDVNEEPKDPGSLRAGIGVRLYF